jgi:hypothetical protein
MSDSANPAADAAARMMQDMWKAFMPAAAASTPSPAAGNPFVPTPDMIRSMQNAFFAAMEENAERMMRTPQFLEAMQKGMQESLAMQQQLRSHLQSNLDQSMRAAGASGTDDASPAIVASLQRIERSLDRITERLDALEAAGASASAARQARKKGASA